MKVSDLKQSNYIKKEECANGILVTIRDCVEENIAKEGASAEMKYVLYFEELEKGLVLNPTNGQLIQSILGSDDSADWNGQKIVLYNEATVMYAGKMIGGIRVRAPRQAAKPQPKPATAQRPIPQPTRGHEQEQAPPDSAADSYADSP